MKYVYSLFFLLLLSAAAFGQETGYKIGQPIQNFTLTSAEGKAASLADYAGSKAVVLVFVNQFCPNGRIYGKRLQEMEAAYTGKGVRFVYISPTISMEDGGAQVKALAAEVPASGQAPYVFPDQGNQVARLFGATKIPEVFVLQASGASFLLKYKGAIDDNPQLETGVRNPYLRQALEAVLANRPVASPENRPFGCMIKRF
jgi:peroxiredoxin